MASNKARRDACVNRNKAICAHYKGGMTHKEIGELYGLSRQRITNICRENGLTQYQGGKVLKGERKRQADYDRINNRCLSLYGITIEEKRRLARKYRVNGNSPTTRYCKHKLDKEKNGYLYTLTFLQWWKIWLDSGHWFQSGRYKGKYIMALSCKSCCTYSKSTVHIIPFTRWKK